MKTKTKKQLKRHIKRGTKFITKKKLLRKKAARQLAQSIFSLIFLLCSVTLVFAITNTKPSSSEAVKTKLEAPKPKATPAPQGVDQAGQASWYALGLPAPDSMTCASTRFPRGSYLLVRNVTNGKSVVCLVNDYGPQPYTRRVIDLSRGSFRTIENLGRGVTQVEIRLVPSPPSRIQFIEQIIGYQLCTQRRSVQYCEQHRQLDRKL